MALIKCPECQNDVSDAAMKCLKCGVQLRKAKGWFFGKLFKYLFVTFNILMLIWLGLYWRNVGGIIVNVSEAEQTEAAIGAALGTGMLMAVWVFGDIILGLLVLFTRQKST